MQRALLAGLFLGPLCGLLGVFVTARRMSFFSDTIAHAALAGVAGGFLLGFQEPTLPVIVFCVAVALLILWLRDNTQLLNDTIMAVLLSASVALGVVLLSFQRGRWADLDKYLFGDVLSVSSSDVTLAACVAVGVATVLLMRLNDLTLLTAHEELAHVAGIRVRGLNRVFVILLTLTVALSIRLLGIVLVTSLLVIPPATARSLASNLRRQLLLSLGLGLTGAVGGILLSYPLDLPSGPTVTLTLTALFLLSLAAGVVRTRRIRSGPSP